MMKKVLVTLLCFVGVPALMAHEFWIQPEKYLTNPGEEISYQTYVGENFTGQIWANKMKRTKELVEFYFDKGSLVIDPIKLEDDSSENTLICKNEGTYLLYLHSNPSYIELDGQKFNDYLKEDGIDNILKLRTSRKELEKSAREKYERFAKTYIQCGEKITDVHEINTGGLLQMILKKNPYSLKNGEQIELKILFNQKPLANKKIIAWQKDVSGKFIGKYEFNTNGKGMAGFVPSGAGIWMISTVHMVPAKDTSYDYHSYWGSVSFQIK